MTAFPQAEVPSMIALGSIGYLRALLEVVAEAKAPAMMVHTHAILVLKTFGTMLVRTPLPFPFALLGS